MAEILFRGKVRQITEDSFGVRYIDGMPINEWVDQLTRDEQVELAKVGLKLLNDDPEHFKDITERYEITELSTAAEQAHAVVPVWVSQDGRTHLIADMPTKYIWNCLGKLQRQLETKPERAVYTGTAEFAEEAVELENRMNDELEQRIRDKINQFEAELRKRGELPS